VATPTNAEAKAFHSAYHLQGHRAGQHYGLYYEGELVALATTAKTSKQELELARWTLKHGVSVQGGLSKVVKAIGKSMITYCDTAKYDGRGYLAAGFTFVSASRVTYWYTDHKERFNRLAFQKHKLAEKGWVGRTEREMANNNGFYQIGGCKQNKYVLTITP